MRIWQICTVIGRLHCCRPRCGLPGAGGDLAGAGGRHPRAEPRPGRLRLRGLLQAHSPHTTRWCSLEEPIINDFMKICMWMKKWKYLFIYYIYHRCFIIMLESALQSGAFISYNPVHFLFPCLADSETRYWEGNNSLALPAVSLPTSYKVLSHFPGPGFINSIQKLYLCRWQYPCIHRPKYSILLIKHLDAATGATIWTMPL